MFDLILEKSAAYIFIYMGESRENGVNAQDGEWAFYDDGLSDILVVTCNDKETNAFAQISLKMLIYTDIGLEFYGFCKINKRLLTFEEVFKLPFVKHCSYQERLKGHKYIGSVFGFQ